MSPEKPKRRKKCSHCGACIDTDALECPLCHRAPRGRGKYHAREQRTIDKMKKGTGGL